jgi:putative DNA primase/helicase
VFYTLRRKLARWAADNKKALKSARPIPPVGFDNRLAANWRILFAIADMAGGTYPKVARAAAIKLSAQSELEESVRVLSALREIFTVHAEMPSKEIVQRLNADPTGEWCEFRGRGPITQRQLAVLLRDFDIHPVLLGRARVSGYKCEQFADAFTRYLPPKKGR